MLRLRQRNEYWSKILKRVQRVSNFMELGEWSHPELRAISNGRWLERVNHSRRKWLQAMWRVTLGGLWYVYTPIVVPMICVQSCRGTNFPFASSRWVSADRRRVGTYNSEVGHGASRCGRAPSPTNRYKERSVCLHKPRRRWTISWTTTNSSRFLILFCFIIDI